VRAACVEKVVILGQGKSPPGMHPFGHLTVFDLLMGLKNRESVTGPVMDKRDKRIIATLGLEGLKRLGVRNKGTWRRGG
jgi:hypothetical protein